MIERGLEEIYAEVERYLGTQAENEDVKKFIGM